MNYLAIFARAPVVLLFLFADCKREDSVVKTYTLNVTAINGTVVKNPNLAVYNIGDIVQLTATSNSGYTFTSWSGDVTDSTNPLSVTMNANKNITANFTIPVNVNVKSTGATGNDSTDDTKAIQTAIDQVAGTGGTVLIPAGTYMINAVTSLNLKSDMTLKMESGAILKAIPNNNGQYNIIKLSSVTKVNIVGGTLQGERASHLGTTGEWGMGIGIYGSSDVILNNITAKDCWGDGFYIGGTITSTNITLDNVISDNNRRQGLSITSADGVVVKNSVFKNTNGTAPMAGIDIEPNAGRVARNVLIIDNDCSNNQTCGIIVQTNNATVTNNNVHDNGSGILIIQGASENRVTNNTVTNNNRLFSPGFSWYHNGGITITTKATGNTITGNTVKGNKPHNIYDAVGGNTISGNIVD
ncbi:MAG: right-handed parallel beta-helix repeat-containing protein [Lentimicrobiaceae bacterium]|nr:right-handed parallel beta-helix repeat-containing protein [Lentimicrobiaceae bacterium]